MNIEALLEKKEQIQVKILRQLVIKHDKVTAQELCDWVNLSRPSVESYLEDISYLGKVMGTPMEVLRQDNKLVLNMADTQSLDEIISFLIHDSVKYRLLLLLFEQPQINEPFRGSHNTLKLEIPQDRWFFLFCFYPQPQD